MQYLPGQIDSYFLAAWLHSAREWSFFRAKAKRGPFSENHANLPHYKILHISDVHHVFIFT